MPKTAPNNILIVEDDRDTAHLVKLHLRDTGYGVDTGCGVDIAHNGRVGLEQAPVRGHDLIRFGRRTRRDGHPPVAAALEPQRAA